MHEHNLYGLNKQLNDCVTEFEISESRCILLFGAYIFGFVYLLATCISCADRPNW